MQAILTDGSLQHGLLCLLAAAAACLAVIAVIFVCFPVSKELSRKLLHMLVIVVLTVWLYAFPDWREVELTMAAFLAAAYAFLLIAERWPLFGFLFKVTSQRKSGELRKSLCAICFVFMLLTAVGWGLLNDRGLALAAIYAWGPGDAAAALVGKRYGKTKIGREKKKSREGSLAMFLLSFIGVFAVLTVCRCFPLWQALPVSLLTAAVTAQVELTVLSGFDTFFCPAAAMAVLCLARLLLN